MNEPSLSQSRSLRDVVVGLSVSESADLAALGLTAAHCRMAVAEVARAVLVAGGSLLYGGRLGRGTFTEVLIEEAQRYGTVDAGLTICLAMSEWARRSNHEFQALTSDLPPSVEILRLDEVGSPIRAGVERESVQFSDPRALTGMRQMLAELCSAQVLVGGKLQGSQGAMPGLIEEATLTLAARKPLYSAGGFGGAASAVCRALGIDDHAWVPEGFPSGAEFAKHHLDALHGIAATYRPVRDGLDGSERLQLAVTHRPSDIAALVVSGLAHVYSQRRTGLRCEM